MKPIQAERVVSIGAGGSPAWSVRVGLVALGLHAVVLALLRAEVLPGPVAVFATACILGWLLSIRCAARPATPDSGMVFLGLLLAAVCVVLSAVFPIEAPTSARVPTASLVAILLMAAPLEELIYRGHLLLPFTNKPFAAGMVTSAVFGLLHFDYGIGGIGYFAVIGAMFAAVSLRHGGISAALVAHVALNTVAAIATLTRPG